MTPRMPGGFLAGGILALALFAAGPALAESPRSMMLELKFAPFHPSIDSEFPAGQGPFGKVFGGGSFLMTRLGFEYEFYQKVGTISVGGQIGYSTTSGKGLLLSGERSSDTTHFYLFPMSLDAIYRFDLFARKWKVPLVPHVKAGFDYYVWWITNGVGKIPQYKDPVTNKVSQGRGGVFGAHVTAGLAFLLDSLSPTMAAGFDADLGVNNTYIFAEFTASSINNFGRKNTLNLSSNTFLFGLAFEF